MCGVMDKNNARFVVVIGGNPDSMIQQCEYLEINEDGTFDAWLPCSPMPISLANAQMATDPESGELLILLLRM